MFGRTSHLALACLRCRTRVAARLEVRSIRSKQSTSPYPCRWQSTTALKVDEDANAKEAGDQAQEILDHESVVRSDFDETDEARGEDTDHDYRLRKRKNFRRWAPHHAEELGVDVLGTPAEVLLLPTRERRILQPGLESGPSEETSGIQQSLDSELRPVSLREVLQNIDSLRTDFAQGKHDFTASQWDECRRTLGDGFTKMQLQEYLRIGSGQDKTPAPEFQLSPSMAKRDMAAKIMSDVWKWTCRDVDETASIPKITLIKKNVAVKAAKLEYIMLHGKQQLSQISEAFDVQIDVFKKKRRIRLSGSESALIAAGSRLNQLVKETQESVIRIPRYLKDVLTDESKAENLCATIMHKHKLLIQRDGEILTVVGPTTISIDTILRDLVVLSGKLRHEMHYSFCWTSGQESATEVPMYPADLPPWLLHSDGWYRHVSTLSAFKAQNLNDKAIIREVRKFASKLLKSEKPDRSRLSHFVIVPGALSHEYTADLGQALFRSGTPESGMNSAASTGQSVAEIALVLQQPMLPQVLSRKDFAGANMKVADEAQHAVLVHLRLRPVIPSWRSPPIDIYLTGQDPKMGLRQRLHIKKVFATLDEWQHMVLLPYLPMDMLIKRRSKLDLLTGGEAKDTNPYLDILRQLGSYLEQIQSSSRARPPPIWRLNTLSLFNSEKTVPLSQNEDMSSKVDPEISEPVSKNVSPGADSSNAYASVYILETPEYLDVARYFPPVDRDRFLDHIVSQTDSADQPRQRQALRVTASSLHNLLDGKQIEGQPETANTLEMQRWFKKSITAACETAMFFMKIEREGEKVGEPSET